MKVKKITINNFRGLKNYEHEFTKPITVLTGPVGAGKTSFLQAMRFAITSETPTNAIRTGADSASVSAVCDDDFEIYRELMRPNKKYTKVMGRKAGTSASESFIEETTNVSNEVMKIATSSEVLAAMKPSEFGAIFLNESVEKKTLEDMIQIMNDSTIKERKAIKLDKTSETYDGDDDDDDGKKLPNDVMNLIKTLFKGKTFNLDAINKAYEEIKSLRREDSAKLKIYKSKAEGFLDIVKPEYSEADLNKRLEEIIGVEKNIDVYKAQVIAYNKAVKAKEQQDKQIAELNIAIAMNTATEPDETEYKALKEKKAAATDSVIAETKVAQTLSDNIKWLKKTLAQLDKSVCPINDKIVCKTDRTAYKADIEESIKKSEMSVAIVNDRIKEARRKAAELEEQITAYLKGKETWNKKQALIKERARLMKNLIEIPEKPDLVEKKDYTVEKNEVRKKIALIRSYKEAEADYKQMQVYKRKYTVDDFLVKSLDPKGPVIKEFINTFVDFLEDACNERAEFLKTGFKLKFVAEDGLKVLFKTAADKDFLPYTSLSAGEKIFASLILTDLINSFYASKILILDDTDHLDAKSFDMLMKFITDSDIEELYDNIIISCVEHDDMLEVLKKYDVDVIKMDIKVTVA